MLKSFLITILLSLVFNSSMAQVRKDTVSLNDLANQEISNFINKQPPIIRVAFYLDGKLIKKGYTVCTFVNGDGSERIVKNKIIIDTGSLKEGDSLAFLFQYLQYSFYTNKVSYKRFLHGGELIVGIVSDYELEREKFVSKSNAYFESNQANQLYDILLRTTKIDKDLINGKHQLEYSVLKSNSSSLVNFKHDFIPLKIVE